MMRDEKRLLELQNRKGEHCTLLLRQYKAGDEAGIIECIRAEYGDTYFKREFYNPAYLKKKAEAGSITFLLAENMQGDIVGMMILKEFYLEESMCEIASQIFKKEYRGFGLAIPLFRYGMDILESRQYSAAYCLPLVLHDITQKLLQRLGLCAAGFILNVFDMDTVTHSYNNGRNIKHSQGIQIKAEGKKNAELLYIPKELRKFCKAVYQKLGVSYLMMPNKCGWMKKSQGQKSILNFQNEERQSSLTIQVYHPGKDLGERIQGIVSKIPLLGKQTANVFLNINDAYAVEAYETLKEKGFFFTGLKPLCGEMEWMVLHHPGEIEIFFDDYVLSTEFAEIMETVRRCYEKRIER